MKKIISVVAVALLWITSLSAQVPQRLSYQAVVRDVLGYVVSNQELEVRIDILQGSIDGSVSYSETHATSTTANGVISLEVGGGVTTDDFSSIDWGKGPFFIRSTAEFGGKVVSVTSELLSVPYAFYANKAFVADKVDESFLQEIIDARIQNALADRDSVWEKRLSELVASMDKDSVVATPVLTPVNKTNGILPGKFTVADGRIIHFSQGVLQYNEKMNVWRFAEDQLTSIGKSYKDYNSSPANGWVDLFEYATSGYNGSYPATPYGPYEIDDWEYQRFQYTVEYDWGYNKISNGGNSSMWCNLSSDDVMALLTGRDNAENLLSHAEVDGVKGMILLPDDWTTPSDLSFTPMAADCSVNVYDKYQWSKMESLGAAFFPNGVYWTYLCDKCYDFNWSLHTMSFPDSYYPSSEYGYCGFSSPRDLFPVRLVVSDSDAERMKDDVSVVYEDDTTSIADDSLGSPVDTVGVDMKAGLLAGRFSVSDSTQVSFSQGNLQYQKSTGLWKFADKQYESTGLCNHSVDSDWIDLFRWATSGYAGDPFAEFIVYGREDMDIAGTKYDWGVYNPISNGGDTPNIWRTLTKEEWDYVVDREKDGMKLSATAIVEGKAGLILLPDDWTPILDLPFQDSTYVFYDNRYTSSEWDRMEAKGAVFLPAEWGDKVNYDWLDLESYNFKYGGYWSSSAADMYAWIYTFQIDSYESAGSFSPKSIGDYYVYVGISQSLRDFNYSVRLVRDIK